MHYRFPRWPIVFTSWLSLVCLTLSSIPITKAQSYTIPAADLEAGFNPEAILEDKDLFNEQGMTREGLEAFLSARGTLGAYRTQDIDGQEKPAAEIIWRVSQSYKMNPKYLLVLLQKEQSLVEDPQPSQKQFDWAAGYGVCDSCSMDDPAIQAYKGFANQLEWAAKQHREKYLLQILSKGSTIAGQAPGKSTVIDGYPLTPQNHATAMLYSYTPHLHGNINAWRIWQRWFTLEFPHGTVVRELVSKQLYLISHGKKRPIANLAVATSLVQKEKILEASADLLAPYPLGKPMRFPNYSLVEAKNQRYLLVGSKKRPINSKAAFRELGFNEDEVLSTEVTDIEDYTLSEPLTTTSTYPTGLLVKDQRNTYWYIEAGERHEVPDKVLVQLYFSQQKAKRWNKKQLQAYTVSTPYQLHDGELVRSATSSAVYVIEQGFKRPIPSARVFEELGWQWKHVVTLPETILNAYPTGNIVNPHLALL